MTPTTTKARPPAKAAGAGSGHGVRRRIDPRIKERRTEVTRQQGRRRLRILVIGLIGTALLVGVYLLLHTPLLSARSITVSGATHETAAQVIAQAGLASHPPLIDVNAGTAARALEGLPWVQTATVHVSWPDGVRITVHEETPRLAQALPGNKWAVMSTDGRVLEVDTTPPTGLLTFTSPVMPGAPGSMLGARDQVGLRVAATLPPSFVAQVTGVTVEPGGWVQLAMTTPILFNIGSAAQLPAKYEDVSAFLAGATLHNGDVIDVSVPGAPTVTGP